MPPREFTPEITQAFFERLAGNIRKRGERARGLARSEALAHGLTQDPHERAAVGAARAGTARELAGLEADIGFRVAGLRREERLGATRREFQAAEREKGREFESAEAAKERAFRQKMGQMGWAYQQEAAKTASRRALQRGILTGAITGVAGGLGRFFGG